MSHSSQTKCIFLIYINRLDIYVYMLTSKAYMFSSAGSGAAGAQQVHAVLGSVGGLVRWWFNCDLLVLTDWWWWFYQEWMGQYGDHQVMDGGDFSENMWFPWGFHCVKATNMGLTKHPGGAYVLGGRHIELVNGTWSNKQNLEGTTLQHRPIYPHCIPTRRIRCGF